MTTARPNLLRIVRSCAKWRGGYLLVATLFLIGCVSHVKLLAVRDFASLGNDGMANKPPLEHTF